MFKLTPLIFLIISSSLFAKIGHVRVLFQEKPFENAVIAFTHFGSTAEKAKIFYDEVPRNGTLEHYKIQEKFKIRRRYVSKSKDLLFAQKLENLKPSTKYYFTIKLGNFTSKEFYFITAPKDPKAKFKLIFGGDSRSNPNQRRQMNQMIKDMVEKNPDILALVHGGDMVWNGGRWSLFNQWLTDHAQTQGKDGRILPLIVARGNHEGDVELFNNVFVQEKHLTNNYYQTQMGKMVLFNLNTNLSHKGGQLNWLLDKLNRIPKEHHWLLANYHRPAWPAVKSPGRAKKYWVPLFEKYQFDLVFESDGHTLKKTQPIYKNKMDIEKGIIYVGEGGLGVKLRRPSRNRWYLESPGYAASEYHLFMLDVGPEKMTCSVILKNFSTYDSFDLKPRPRPI